MPTTAVFWLRALPERPKEALARREKCRLSTSVVSVDFVRDRRKQAKDAERSAAPKGRAGEPNNKRRWTPDKKECDRREHLIGVSGEQRSRDRRRRKPIAKKKSGSARKGVPTDCAVTVLASPKAKPSLYRLASTFLKRKADEQGGHIFLEGSVA